MTSIYCYGDINYEQHIFLEEYVYSNDTPVKSVNFNVGGSAFNTASALAKMGQNVNLICSIGKDIEGKYIKEFLYKIKNIKTDFVDFSNNKTSKVYALVNNSNEHKFLSFRCNDKKLRNIIKKININKNDFINISGYTFQDENSQIISRKLIDKCKKNLGILCIDPSLNYAENFHKVDRDYSIDYFFPNQEEASIISGVSDYKKAAEILLSKNIKNVLITLAGNGCYFINSDHRKLYKSKLIIEKSLSIGAGDNFVAGFISAKINNFSIEECVQKANKSALEHLSKNN